MVIIRQGIFNCESHLFCYHIVKSMSFSYNQRTKRMKLNTIKNTVEQVKSTTSPQMTTLILSNKKKKILYVFTLLRLWVCNVAGNALLHLVYLPECSTGCCSDLCRCCIALSCLRAGRANIAECWSCCLQFGSTLLFFTLIFVLGWLFYRFSWD